ncbi:unnamed protein product [Pleuronectes platessa]|uniref:Olfactomedin-like domain-containing protein n=1 Tax=Pleuronectes platessa TaxID=8262 RepID=A0A9N7YSB4_PLEPL|nr:unnamed protein product [Pleuronectes platessa]
MIHTSNPTTNTIQGPNVVLFSGALYNCKMLFVDSTSPLKPLPHYNYPKAPDLTQRETSATLMNATRSPIWTWQQMSPGSGLFTPPPRTVETWCCPRYIDKEVEEIFYSFDTVTGVEKFNIGIFIRKMSPNIYSLNYSPVDQMLHAYCDSIMVSYEVLFE